MKVGVRRVLPRSLARVLAICLGGLTLLWWPMLLPKALLAKDTGLLVFFGLAPVIYAAIGWLMDMFIAWLYNLAAGRGLGLQLELEVESTDETAAQ